MPPRKAKKQQEEPVKATTPLNEPSDAPLQDCLASLNSDFGTIPLVGREKQIQIISDFIDHAFEDNKFKILYISGSPGTGKTASVQHCINLAPNPNEIYFVNCKSSKPSLITPEEKPPKILILDEVETLPNYQNFVTNCKRYNCCILCISNSHDRTISISKSHTKDQKSLIFEPYTSDELVSILIERTGGPNKHIQVSALKYISTKIGQSHGDARTILSTMNYILGEAIRQGITDVDIPTAMNMIDDQKKPDPVHSILQEIPLIEQIALVAIMKAGKNWIKEFSQYAAQKKIRVPPNIKEFYDRLLDYGVVSGSVKSPKCSVTKEQLQSGLDPIASVFL